MSRFQRHVYTLEMEAGLHGNEPAPVSGHIRRLTLEEQNEYNAYLDATDRGAPVQDEEIAVHMAALRGSLDFAL